jgi:hypothetical protein
VKEGFTNQKKNNSDEFLVEKKSPLVMPPDYDALPEPKKDILEKNLSENQIKTLLTSQKDKSKDSEIKKDINKNFEESLLEKIKDN